MGLGNPEQRGQESTNFDPQGQGFVVLSLTNLTPSYSDHEIVLNIRSVKTFWTTIAEVFFLAFDAVKFRKVITCKLPNVGEKR